MNTNHFRLCFSSTMHDFIAIIIAWLQFLSACTLCRTQSEDFLFPCGPRNCGEVKKCWLPNLPNSLVYSLTINVLKSEAKATGFGILCHIDETGTSWTILMLRNPRGPDVSFDRTWSEYENGFGTIHNFWLGLKRVHRMTASRLNVIKQDHTWSRDAAFYCDRFSVDDADKNYTLRLGNCIGRYQISESHVAPFSTPDHDSSPGHCAKALRSGWWYTASCKDAILSIEIGIEKDTGMLRGSALKGSGKLSLAHVEFREEKPNYLCDKACPNGGTCRAKSYNTTTFYTCECAPGYTGWRCEQFKCAEFPCMNNGLCSSNGSCSCEPSYTGKRYRNFIT